MINIISKILKYIPLLNRPKGSWINGGVAYAQLTEPWKSFGNEMREAYGEFYRTGQFPANTLKQGSKSS